VWGTPIVENFVTLAPGMVAFKARSISSMNLRQSNAVGSCSFRTRRAAIGGLNLREAVRDGASVVDLGNADLDIAIGSARHHLGDTPEKDEHLGYLPPSPTGCRVRNGAVELKQRRRNSPCDDRHAAGRKRQHRR
jgi:hypothetical protein